MANTVMYVCTGFTFDPPTQKTINSSTFTYVCIHILILTTYIKSNTCEHMYMMYVYVLIMLLMKIRICNYVLYKYNLTAEKIDGFGTKLPIHQKFPSSSSYV